MLCGISFDTCKGGGVGVLSLDLGCCNTSEYYFFISMSEIQLSDTLEVFIKLYPVQKSQ